MRSWSRVAALSALLWIVPGCDRMETSERSTDRGSAPAVTRQLHPGVIVVIENAEDSLALTLPAPRLALEDGEALHPFAPPPYRASLRGWLRVLEGGHYRFRVPPGCELLVDGRGVADPPAFLSSGDHRIELAYEHSNGPLRVDVFWSSENFEEEPIPARLFFHEKDSASERAESIEHGRMLFEELHCVRCHDAPGLLLKSIEATDLSEVGRRARRDWIERWLEDPRALHGGARMPRIDLTPEERMQLARYLADLHSRIPDPPPTAASAAAIDGDARPDPARQAPESAESGEELFRSIGCAACHGPGGVSLAFVAAKYPSGESLADYLLDPLSVDRSGRMPKLLGISGRDLKEERAKALSIAAHLLGNEAQTERPIPSSITDASGREQAESLLVTKGCLCCHALKPSHSARCNALGVDLSSLGVEAGPWRILGPLPMGGAFEAADDLVAITDFGRSYNGQSSNVLWQEAAFADGVTHTLFPEHEQAVAWLYREIESAHEMDLLLSVGCDDQIKVYLNGEKIHESLKNNVKKPVDVRLSLRAGKNPLLLKLGDIRFGWQFVFELSVHPEVLDPPPENQARAPLLGDLRADQGCLADAPPARVPSYSLSAEDKAHLRAFLAVAAAVDRALPAPAAEARRRVQALLCHACHEHHDLLTFEELRETPPPLSIAGAKMRTSWLQQVLLEHLRVRPWMSLRMPVFRRDAVEPLIAALAAESGVGRAEVEEPPTSREQRLRGSERLGIGEVGLSCISCHDFRDYTALGTRGPDLTRMHARIRPDWFRLWMRQPARVLPGTSMPSFFLNHDRARFEVEAEEIWAALSMDRSMSPPPGTGLNLAETGDRPSVQRPALFRTFMPDSGPASIAVGLDGMVSYCWDTAECRMRYAWEGDFLDMRPQWAWKGEKLPIVLGRRFLETRDGYGLHWKTAAGARTVRYRGFRWKGSAPQLLYDLDGVPVAERIVAADHGLGVVHEFEVAAMEAELWFAADVSAEIESAARVTSDRGEVRGRSVRVPAGPAPISFAVTVRVEESTR